MIITFVYTNFQRFIIIVIKFTYPMYIFRSVRLAEPLIQQATFSLILAEAKDSFIHAWLAHQEAAEHQLRRKHPILYHIDEWRSRQLTRIQRQYFEVRTLFKIYLWTFFPHSVGAGISFTSGVVWFICSYLLQVNFPAKNFLEFESARNHRFNGAVHIP